jgi:AcrR family transcriptional regulator
MKTDARVRYTKMRIREAFFQCLREKPVSRITVKELCDIAEINRATFYTHYRDPFDLLEKLEEETLAGLRRMVSEREFHGEDGLLLTMLQGMQSEKSETGLLASRNGDPNFGARISALFYETYLPRLEKQLPGCTDAQRHAIYRFITGGCANLLTDWVNRGMREKPEEVAKQMKELTAAVLAAYNTNLQ